VLEEGEGMKVRKTGRETESFFHGMDMEGVKGEQPQGSRVTSGCEGTTGKGQVKNKERRMRESLCPLLSSPQNL